MAPEVPLQILSMLDSDGGLVAVVFVSSPEVLRTSAVPGLADAAMTALPGLERQRCECGSAHGICAELGDTETPHLLEHIALELLALAGHPRGELHGRTTWDFKRDGAGMFRVALEGASANVCRRALEEAAVIANALLGGEAPYAAGSVERVRLAYDRPAG